MKAMNLVIGITTSAIKQPASSVLAVIMFAVLGFEKK